MALVLNGSGTIQADDITLSGNANVTGTMTSTGAFTSTGVLTPSAGIYLGGTDAANLLDDYEYGTWTPTVTGSTIAGSSTYVIQTGGYVKIGKQVIAQCFIQFGSSHSGTGAMKISLPFTSAGTSSSYGGATVSYKTNWVSNGPDFMQIEQSAAFGYLRYDNNTTIADLNPTSVTQTNTAFMLIINYQVA
jgi:hypothetical protein